MNALEHLQSWYKLNCNGDWEHDYGIRISTLDNPGWELDIDLKDTVLEGFSFSKELHTNDEDWYIIKTEANRFSAYGDATKLGKLVELFINEFFIPNVKNANVLYDIYAPLIDNAVEVWRPMKAKIISLETLEVIEIPPLSYKELKVTKAEDFELIDMDNLQDVSYQLGDKIAYEVKKLFDHSTLVAVS